MSSDLLPPADVLEAARDLFESHQPFRAYCLIREKQLLIGEWAPPPLSSEQKRLLKEHDRFLARFPDA